MNSGERKIIPLVSDATKDFWWVQKRKFRTWHFVSKRTINWFRLWHKKLIWFASGSHTNSNVWHSQMKIVFAALFINTLGSKRTLLIGWSSCYNSLIIHVLYSTKYYVDRWSRFEAIGKPSAVYKVIKGTKSYWYEIGGLKSWRICVVLRYYMLKRTTSSWTILVWSHPFSRNETWWKHILPTYF